YTYSYDLTLDISLRPCYIRTARSGLAEHFVYVLLRITPPPPTSPLFPYTTLFRSVSSLSPRSRHCTRASEQRQSHPGAGVGLSLDRKSTRLNSSHQIISYAVFRLKKKTS